MKARDFFQRSGPPMLSGVLLTLSLPPFNLGLVAFVALIPWLLQVRTLTERRDVFRAGAWLAIPFFAGQMYWIVPFIGRWTGAYAVSIGLWITTVLIQILYFWLLAFLVNKAYRNGRNWAIPFAWIAVEALRSSVPFLAFPGGVLASSIWRMPALIQGAAFGTIFFVSGWIVFANVIGAEIYERREPRATIRLIMVFVLLMIGSLMRYQEPVQGKIQRIATGQTGVDMAFGNPTSRPYDISESVQNLFAQAEAARVDLLVLPEGVASTGKQMPPMLLFGLPPVPTVFGGQREDQNGIYQSSFGYSDGQWTVSDKTRLVIFGEYVPFRRELSAFGTLNLPSLDLIPGKQIGMLSAGGLKVGPVICFETMFFDIAAAQQAQGAQILAVQSIDDWYFGSGMPEQLLASTAYRSVESGLPAARAASLGISAMFDGRGNIVISAPMHQRKLSVAELTIPDRGDGFAYRGLFPWLAALVAVFATWWPKRSLGTIDSQR